MIMHPLGDTSGIGMMMKLRKISNHPLLVRHHYTDEKLLKLAKQYCMVCVAN